jgi:hypothetical protein
MYDNKLINHFKEMEEHENSFVSLSFRLINNFFVGVWMIMVIIIIALVLGIAVLVMVGLPIVAFEHFVEGHEIMGSVLAILSLIVWGTAFRMT